MKRLFYAACGLLFLGACASLNQSNEADSASAGGTYNADGVFVAYCSGEPAPVIYTKEGFPIIDDQACIPEPEVLGIQVTRAEKTCPTGKLLVGNVCLSHNPKRRTTTAPCGGAGDQNPLVSGVQCEAPEDCDDGELRNDAGICYTPIACDGAGDLNPYVDGIQCTPPAACADGELRNDAGVCYTPIACDGAGDLNPYVDGIQCTPPAACADGELRNDAGVCYTPIPCDGAGDLNPYVDGIQCTPPTCADQGLLDINGTCEQPKVCTGNFELDESVNECVCPLANPGNDKCVGGATENPNDGDGWNEDPGETGNS